MRLWSIHPKFLDSKGLVALWREGLLARNVIIGNTKGYRHHPQLHRFQKQNIPLIAIDSYLSYVLDESKERRYEFDANKIIYNKNIKMTVTSGQLKYEWVHLMNKLKIRDHSTYNNFCLQLPEQHPCFTVIDGPIESWEKYL